jgi:hypothetical protein
MSLSPLSMVAAGPHSQLIGLGARKTTQNEGTFMKKRLVAIVALAVLALATVT